MLTGGRVWRGNLFLVGTGDPTLDAGDLGSSPATSRPGVPSRPGRVVGDERHFDSRRDAPGWKPLPRPRVRAPLGALGRRRRHPRRERLGRGRRAALTAALERRGIAVDGAPRTGRAPADALPLAHDLSEPLSTSCADERRERQLHLGDAAEGARSERRPEADRSAAGARVVADELRDAGVPVMGVRIADGSGLSRLDRLTAQSLVGDPPCRPRRPGDQRRVRDLARGRRDLWHARAAPRAAARPAAA